jgi:hypothetical protein
MAIRFDTSRLTIAITAPNVKPDVFINSTVGHVICHLTQGFNESSFPTGQGDAFTAAAHMPLIMAPTDTLSGWDFGFVQFAWANLCRIFYAGGRRSEGSIGVAVHVPPRSRARWRSTASARPAFRGSEIRCFPLRVRS